MLRVYGLVGLLGLALLSIGWSLASFPDGYAAGATVHLGDLAFDDDPTGAAPGSAGSTASPLEALAGGGLSSRDDVVRPSGRGLQPGVYQVGEAEPLVVNFGRGRRRFVRDRDYKPVHDPYSGPASLVVGTVGRTVDRELQGEIEPGLYATAFDASDCRYELTMVTRDRDVMVIGEDGLDEGRVLVTINEIEPDWFVSSSGCGSWYRWTPLPVPLTRAGNGDYGYGDLSPGTWDVPRGCQWEVVTGFRGARLSDVLAAGAGPQKLVVGPDTYGVRVRNCREPMTLRLG